jgi:hypothetical protein
MNKIIPYPKPQSLLVLGACVVFTAGLTPDASAALIAYEPFDYTVGASIDGLSGGTGFSSAWGGYNASTLPAGSSVIQAGSLSLGGVPASGNSVLLTGQNGTAQFARSFANVAGTDGTTLWFSFLGQRVGGLQEPPASGTNVFPRGVNVGLFDTEATANASSAERIAIGNSSNATENEWSIINEGSGSARVGAGLTFDTLAWAVVRIDFHGDATVADDIYLWLNPDPGAEPSTGSAAASSIGAFDYSNVDILRPFIGDSSSGRPAGQLLVDEIRLGTLYADMSVVPEPSTVGLAALGGVAMLLRSRKR